MKLPSRIESLRAPYLVKRLSEFQAVITEIANHYEFDLDEVGGLLTLELEAFEGSAWLSIERIAPTRVVVSRYFMRDQEKVFFPRVVIFTGYRYWVALSTEIGSYGVDTSARLNADGTTVKWVDAERQEEMADYCNYDVADRLCHQGWTQSASRRE